MDASGIYEIRNVVNGKRYIGSAVNLSKRWTNHKKAANGGYHDNQIFQRAWNKYGLHSFNFKPLLICSKENLLFYEQMALDKLKPDYNIAPTAGSMLGFVFSEEARKNMSLRRKGRKHSAETRAKISAGQTGNKRSAESNAKNSAAQKKLCKKLSPEHRQKLSIANRGKIVSAETRAKLSVANIRRWTKTK